MTPEDMAARAARLREGLNRFSGVSEELRPSSRVLLGLWWALLLLVALAFGGHLSKFVYVDF
jgi:hypothetical protein